MQNPPSGKSRVHWFDRYELKYLLDDDQARRISDILEEKCALGIWQSEKYVVTNLYFDSPDYRCLWEKLEGRQYRRKLRIRQYVPSGERNRMHESVSLEIKQKYGTRIIKRRMGLPFEMARDIVEGGRSGSIGGLPWPEHASERNFMREAAEFAGAYHLKPVCVLDYMRHAYKTGSGAEALRLTFDTDIRFRASGWDADMRRRGESVRLSHSSLMEIKLEGNMPLWIARTLGTIAARQSSYSKYTRCMGSFLGIGGVST